MDTVNFNQFVEDIFLSVTRVIRCCIYLSIRYWNKTKLYQEIESNAVNIHIVIYYDWDASIDAFVVKKHKKNEFFVYFTICS
jgi:Gpi18-like mannosyltransferase